MNDDRAGMVALEPSALEPSALVRTGRGFDGFVEMLRRTIGDAGRDGNGPFSTDS